MIPPEAQDIVRTLLSKTRAGKLRWEPTTFRMSDEDWTLLLPDSAVRLIYRHGSMDSGWPASITVTVLDDDGRRAFAFDTTADERDDFEIMKSLLHEAGKTHGDAVLSSLRGALEAV
jgi:hypothetical protein